jgi:phosphoribosylformylglycinamidine synthase
VTGGNVSFYNQSPDGPVFPTPVIGMVGVLDKVQHRMTLNFKKPDDVIYLLGQSRDDINSSAYLYHVLGEQFSPAPHFDLEEEFSIQQMAATLVKSGLLQSAHDVSDGGLFTTLLESAMAGDLGFEIDSPGNIRKDAFLFGEAQGRIVFSVVPENCAAVERLMAGMHFEILGRVTENEIGVDGERWGTIRSWKERYDTVLEDLMEGEKEVQ